MTAAMKLDLSTRTFAAAIIGLAIVIAGAGWFVSVGPTRAHAAKLQTTIQSKETQLAVAEREAQHPGSGATGPGRLGALQAAMPDAIAMPQVVDQLNALAARAHVVLDTVTPAPATLGTGYQAVPLTVVVDGHYFAVEQFLHLIRGQVASSKDALHATGRLFDVQGVQLDETEPVPTVTATMTVRAFSFAPQATPTATTSTGTTSTDTTSTTTSTTSTTGG